MMDSKMCLFINQHLDVIKYKNMSTEYVFSWKSKGRHNNKDIALNSDFLPNIKYFFKKDRITI